MWSHLLRELAQLVLGPPIILGFIALAVYLRSVWWPIRALWVVAALVGLPGLYISGEIVWANVAEGCFFAPPAAEPGSTRICPGQSMTISIPLGRMENPLDGPPRPLHLR